MAEETLKTYVDKFEHSEPTNVRTDIKRNFLAHYVNVGTTSKEWEILGYKVEDASVEFNWNEEKVTDITGITYSSITKSEPEMSLEGYIINTKSTFLKTLSSMAIRNAYEEFSNFEILTVYWWLKDTNGGYLAKVEKDCTIKPDSIGGQDYARITPTISFSNNATFGTAKKDVTDSTKVTFTERTEA